MSSAFADTHNMVAILTKSDASEGFDQILDFLNGSYIQYALTVNPYIYVSCIKQFWNTVTVKQSTDVSRLQALVDKKKVMISEAVIRYVLRLDDAEGVDFRPNEEIFTGLARMGYEKPSTKLTFYKAFFSSQWKFLIHTILQSLSAKRTSWNEFSSTMASAVICLSTGRKFNFSKCIFDSLVRNVDSSSKFYMYPRFVQLIIQNQLGDLSTHTTKYISPALTQKVFAKMRRVGKGFSGVETHLFEGMLVVQENMVEGIADEQVHDDAAVTTAPEDVTAALESDKLSQALEITRLKKMVKRLKKGQKVKVFKLRRLKKVGTSQRVKTSDDTIMEDVSNQGRMVVELDKGEGIELMGEKEKTEQSKDIAHDDKVEGRQTEKQAEIYQIDMDHAIKVLSMHEEESTEVQEVVEVVTTAKLITEVVTAASAPTKKKMVIRDPEEESTAITPAETKSKDKGKSIMVEEPKPLKKKQQVEIDEAYAKKLHEEFNQDIDWDVAIEHVKQKAKEDPFIQRYQVMKKSPQTEAQARWNMITYLKNTVGFRLDLFKGMSYDDIHSIFEAKFNTNMEFLLKSKEQMEEEEKRAIEKATPLARKVPVMDYQIIHLNNKPRYKIIRADETHQLYVSFITLLNNFDREDLESLWSIVKERFSTSKPNNFSDEYLLTTLKTMFGRPDGQDNLILLVKRRYLTSKSTLEQMLNVVRLQVEEKGEMSLELLRFTRQQLPERQQEQWLNTSSMKPKNKNGIKLVEQRQKPNLMLPWSLTKNTKCFNAAGEELSAIKHKLMLLDTVAEGRVNTAK
nr:hypothetical protein [Tanacetum cinerariifolium]